MIKVFMVLLILSVASIGMAEEYETESLVCDGKDFTTGRSCVSKASIEKDKAQIKLMRVQEVLAILQIEQIKEAKSKKKK
jgi:hypothetical protein